MCDENGDLPDNPGPIEDLDKCPVCFAPITRDNLCECILM